MRITDPSSLVFGALLAVIVGGAVGFIAAQALGLLAGVGVGGVLGTAVALFHLRGPLRRWRTARRALAPARRRWLERHILLYAALEEENARRRFERDVQFFLREHTFEGIDGVAVDDELRLAVAAGAALMLHGRPSWELRGAGRSVLFYPGAFDDDYHAGDYAAFDGMAHQQGPVLLSARAVRESWSAPGDGQNVVLHELAHLFDFQNEGADGVPSLMAPASEGAWRDLVRRETRRIQRGDSMLRSYAASAPSEFFAVAVEAFFERPAEMQRRHAALYDALKNFFNLDLASLGGKGETEREKKGSSSETPFQDRELRDAVRETGGDLTQPPGA
jgi:Mlc titration factor MtfA (ptsG expression regulator)